MKTIRHVIAGLPVVTALLLAACGGGSPSSSSAKYLPTYWTSEERALQDCMITPGCSPYPTAPFIAAVSGAPAKGASLSGVVRLAVSGNELANVELLPAGSYTPRYGVFNISKDRTTAWLDFDTRRVANGALKVRISAFDKPAGQSGAREIVAMSPRTWTISNTALPGGAFSAAVSAAPANNAVVRGKVHLDIRGSHIANAELIPANASAPAFGVFNVSADRTHAWLDFDTRSLPDGMRSMRIAAYSVMPGQPGAQQIIAMPARSWDFRNGATSAFTGTITEAPLNGEIVSGTVELAVSGAGIGNAELLPASGYSPNFGTFYKFSDYSKVAHLNLDTTTLPNGPFTARVSIFSTPPGQPGAKEIVAMPARQWIIRN